MGGNMRGHIQSLGRIMRMQHRSDVRKAMQPHSIDIHSGQYEQEVTARRMVDLVQRVALKELQDPAMTTRAMGGWVLSGEIEPRPDTWCAADTTFVRLMQITRLDRSRLE